MRDDTITWEDRTDDDIPQHSTVTRHGLPSPSADPEQACLIPIFPPGPDLGRRIDLPNGHPFIVGRDPEANLQLADQSVSRLHASLQRGGEHWAVSDLGSKNGTYVNGERVSEQMLQDGDLLVVGGTILKFLTGRNVEFAYHQELYRLTVIDSLTHTYNHRYFDEQLRRELAQSDRSQRPLSLAMLDIDDFKYVNDVHGHAIGDVVLREIASRMLRRIRGTDLLARYGGEEFALLLPDTPTAAALPVVERVRELVAEQPISHRGLEIEVTISAGVATTVGEPADKALRQRADAYLYRAKRTGRNRVVGEA